MGKNDKPDNRSDNLIMRLIINFDNGSDNDER